MTERGWSLLRAGTLTAAVVVTAPISPLVLVAVPAAVQLLAFRRDDVLSLVLAGGLLAFTFAGAGASPDPLWYAERGWALLVGGGFVAATAVWRRAGLTGRSVAAVGMAASAVAAVGLLQPGLLTELDWWVERELATAAMAAAELMSAVGMGGAVRETGYLRALEWQHLLYPAFLALASVASLAVGRFVVERMSGREEALGPFREFRFEDRLVWVLVAGLALVLAPADPGIVRLGENAVLFMGGLYLLRGVAVLFWVGAATVTSGWSAALWIVAGLALYPVAVLTALALGLGDTWLDVRRRLAGLLTGDR